MWKKLKNLFSRKKPDALARFRTAPFALTLEQWRANEQLVSEWAKVTALPIYRAFTEMMRNESPSWAKLEHVGTLITDRAALQAIIQGYNMALSNMRDASNLDQVYEEPEATFAPEQPQEY